MTFDQAMQASGLIPRAIVADGKWRRCATVDKPKRRNGAYVLHPDGRGYWKNWATDSELNTWRDDAATVAPQIDHAALERDKARARQERMKAVHAARDFWGRCSPLRGGHPYLARKCLNAQGCSELRQSGELLVVPVMWKGRIISLQTIAPDGQKRFWKGAPVRSGCFVIERAGAAVTAVCEGLATGLAIFQCVRNARVIVAFDAGNLQPVVDLLRPKGSVVICADDDHATQARRGFNPGREKATNAAELIGAGVAWPVGIEGTDWADALLEWGPAGQKRIERQILAGVRYVT